MRLEKETLKEIGKAFFNLANMLIVLSLVNVVFNNKANIPIQLVFIFIFWVVFFFYIGGAILLNKGAKDD